MQKCLCLPDVEELLKNLSFISIHEVLAFVLVLVATHSKKCILHYDINIKLSVFLYSYLWPTKLVLYLIMRQLPFIQDSLFTPLST